MDGGSDYAIRTVVVPHRLEPDLFRALFDLRGAVNDLVVDWRAHPDESRFSATKRTYPLLRDRYSHLAASWCITMANETSAVLAAWDRSIRRAKKEDPTRFERMRGALPCRRQLKASLHRTLFRFNSATGSCEITVRAGRHVSIDLSAVGHPLFRKYGMASGWNFGLTLRPSALLFHFRVPTEVCEPSGVAGVDLNFDSADLATSDGALTSVDLCTVTRIQNRMALKRQSIARRISKDLRHQRAVLRRYNRRETRRVNLPLHLVANEILARAGPRALAVENLAGATQAMLRGDRPPLSHEGRRRLSGWTHGRLAYLLSYKSRTPIIWVNPEGTSQECPRCGGHLALPSGGEDSARPGRMTRQVVCEVCGGGWHRDAAAAIAVLARGCRVLRGATVPPSARSALLEAASWRPAWDGRASDRPTSGLMENPPSKGDDAKSWMPRASKVSG